MALGAALGGETEWHPELGGGSGWGGDHTGWRRGRGGSSHGAGGGAGGISLPMAVFGGGRRPAGGGVGRRGGRGLSTGGSVNECLRGWGGIVHVDGELTENLGV